MGMHRVLQEAQLGKIPSAMVAVEEPAPVTQ